MASHLRDVAKQWWYVAILQRWVTTQVCQKSTQRIHYKRRRIPYAGTRTRFSWRRLRFQPVLPRVLDQCQRVVLRLDGKYNQESVEVLPVRGGERVQVVRLHLWRQWKSRSLRCYSISLLSAQFLGMITPRPQTHCVQSFQTNMARLSKTMVTVKGIPQLWGFNVKYKVIADQLRTQVYKDQNKSCFHSKCLFLSWNASTT